MAAPQVSTQPLAQNIIFQGKPQCCGAFGDWCAKTNWLITTSYIQKESGLCCSKIDNLELLRVKDLTYKGCCCCCGTITIYSSDETSPILYIKGITGSVDVYHKIRDAVAAIHSGAKLDLDVK